MGTTGARIREYKTMATNQLSPREKEIVELAAEGLTNEAIAHRLGLSIGTVNTYWLRIKLKVGGSGRTETVVNVFKVRAARELDQERVDWEGLAAILEKRGILDVAADREKDLEIRTALALLHLAMDQMQSTVWATDKDLTIHVIANGELLSNRFGVKWEAGKTVYEIFKTEDKANPAVAAHLAALAGSESSLRLNGEFANLFLRVLPLADELGEVTCCISIINSVAE
jgi:DNA-binding CsgD family transcriptional regulator